MIIPLFLTVLMPVASSLEATVLFMNILTVSIVLFYHELPPLITASYDILGSVVLLNMSFSLLLYVLCLVAADGLFLANKV